jgi:hypothetical protein
MTAGPCDEYILRFHMLIIIIVILITVLLMLFHFIVLGVNHSTCRYVVTLDQVLWLPAIVPRHAQA